ncbi:MAG: GNAT family N-acetyltransferase [Acidobacteriota bacterium]|nr:GNAT family N-acetyltransferase [Acidobacteriota bacterium]
MSQRPELPAGEPTDFAGATPPAPTTLTGRHVTLRPIDSGRDAEPLYAASHPPSGDPTIWTYLYDGPYPDLESFRASLSEQAARPDYVFFTVTRATDGQPLGIVSYLSIVPEHGVIEIGNIWFSAELQRTAAATETIFLLARHAFDELGHRRLEWKCNALNEPSRIAAARFGFGFEGVFLNHRVVKGHNRDTAWFAITQERWPAVRAAFEAWLQPDNFGPDGRQRTRLSELTART